MTTFNRVAASRRRRLGAWTIGLAILLAGTVVIARSFNRPPAVNRQPTLPATVSTQDAIKFIQAGTFASLSPEDRTRVANAILERIDRGELDPKQFVGTPHEPTMMRVMLTAMDGRAAAYARISDPAARTAFLDAELEKLALRLKHRPAPPMARPPGEQKKMLETENPMTLVTRFAFISAMSRRAEERGMKLPGPF
jgi:hypothetical protein